MPEPVDLTPADTSSTVVPGLAVALRDRFPSVDEVVVAFHPNGGTVASVRAAADADLASYPAARTHLATYSILPDTLAALLAAGAGIVVA
jgi:hypothetical protein